MEVLGNEHAVESGLLGKPGVFYEKFRLKLLMPAKVMKVNVGHRRPIIAYAGRGNTLIVRQALRPTIDIAISFDELIRWRAIYLLAS